MSAAHCERISHSTLLARRQLGIVSGMFKAAASRMRNLAKFIALARIGGGRRAKVGVPGWLAQLSEDGTT